MNRTINTRTKYKIVGSDYSAQEPRMTGHISGEPNIIKAYQENKDLYAMIAQSAFDNNYEDNLEFYVPGTVVELDGKRSVSGTGEERDEQITDNSVAVLWYELLETPSGDKTAEDISVGDKIISSEGNLTVADKTQDGDYIKFTFVS